MTRPEGTKEELEARRKQVVKLLEEGFSAQKVAKIEDVTSQSVNRWKNSC